MRGEEEGEKPRSWGPLSVGGSGYDHRVGRSKSLVAGLGDHQPSGWGLTIRIAWLGCIPGIINYSLHPSLKKCMTP